MLLKQWPVHTAVQIAIQEGTKFAGYLGYPCWSSTSAALVVTAWAMVVHMEKHPISLAARDLEFFCSTLHAKLPTEACGLTKILQADFSPKAMNLKGKFS